MRCLKAFSKTELSKSASLDRCIMIITVISCFS